MEVKLYMDTRFDDLNIDEVLRAMEREANFREGSKEVAKTFKKLLNLSPDKTGWIDLNS